MCPTPRAERCHPKMVLERISQPSWSGLCQNPLQPAAPLQLLAPSPPPSPVYPSAPPGSSVTPAPPLISGSPPRSPEPSAPPWPPGSSASTWLVGSPPWAPPPPATLPLVAPPWSRRPSLLHCSSIRQLHRGPSSWLWPGSCCAPPAPGPSCLLPGSSHLHHPLGLSLPPPSRLSFLVLCLLLSSHPPLPFGCFYCARTHLPGGGVMSGLWSCVCFYSHVLRDPVSVSNSLSFGSGVTSC